MGQKHLCDFKAVTVAVSAFVHLLLEGVAPFYNDVTNDDFTKWSLELFDLNHLAQLQGKQERCSRLWEAYSDLCLKWSHIGYFRFQDFCRISSIAYEILAQ